MTDRVEARASQRPFAAFRLLADEAQFLRGPLRAERAAAVAAMLRSLVCDTERYGNRQAFAAQFPDEDTATYLAGHVTAGPGRRPGPTRRLSYVPAPSLGPDDPGQVRLALVAEPRGGDGSRARWLASRLVGQRLRDPTGREIAELAPAEPDAAGPWAAPSTTWASVTPVILPGFDDRRPPRTARLVARALQDEGLEPAEARVIELVAEPFFPGALPSQAYLRPDYLSRPGRRWPAWHLRVELQRPVVGPLCLGAGRHCGLGVLAPAGHQGASPDRIRRGCDRNRQRSARSSAASSVGRT